MTNTPPPLLDDAGNDIDWLPDPDLPLSRYDFDVALSTHDLLQQGITDAFWMRIVLMAASDADAHLLAAHMAHTLHGASMVTQILWRL